jgi:hypothetical protein
VDALVPAPPRAGSTIVAIVSDRRAWLDERCPSCGAAPGARCCDWRWGPRARAARSTPLPHLHIARGWLERSCPTCTAPPGECCATPSGGIASRVHTARLRPGRFELVGGNEVWDELERRDASIAVVPFWGRAGRGGETERIRLSHVVGDELVDVEVWTGRDELTYTLEAPVWDRYGTFAGQPAIRGDVIWTVSDRRVVIVGRRGDIRFEEGVR